jgi:NAD(P)-dependent dehydrogenase (short-subunit alcohol dehydrogenase family)
MGMAEEMLSGRVVAVIGGTTGLGLSAAQACLRAGAAGVVVVGRNGDSVAEAQRTLGERSHAFAGDATDPSTSVRAIELAVEKFGGFHALYHVAGGSGRRMGDGPLHDVTDEGWAFTIQLNQTSLFNSNRAATRYFLDAKQPGSILNMGSVLGFSPSPRFFATHAYAAAKGAVIGMVRSCAAYYAKDDIRFNILAPALVETPMSQRAQGDPIIRAFMKTKQPLAGGRMGLPADLDAAAVYFLSDASRYVTGQVLSIDGGWGVSEGQIPPEAQ